MLRRCRLNRLSHVDRVTGEPVRRYEHDRPRALLHVDVKKLGNIPDGGGWRYRGRVEGAETGRPRRASPATGTTTPSWAPPSYTRCSTTTAASPTPRSTTPVQLQILGLLADNWTTTRIAATLGVTPRAVASQLRRGWAQLGAPARDVATLQALHEGMYVPASFLSAQD